MEQMCLLSNINKHSKGLPYEAAFWPLHLKGVSYKVKHESGQRDSSTKVLHSVWPHGIFLFFCRFFANMISHAGSCTLEDCIHYVSQTCVFLRKTECEGLKHWTLICQDATLSCTIGLLVHKFLNSLYSLSTVWSKTVCKNLGSADFDHTSDWCIPLDLMPSVKMLITFAATSAVLPGDDGTPCDLNGTKQGHISNSCLEKGTIIVPGDWRLVISQITEKVHAFEEFMFKDYGEWWELQAKPYTSEIV